MEAGVITFEARFSYIRRSKGMHSIAPKTTSASAGNTKVRNRQMIGNPIIR